MRREVEPSILLGESDGFQKVPREIHLLIDGKIAFEAAVVNLWGTDDLLKEFFQWTPKLIEQARHLAFGRIGLELVDKGIVGMFLIAEVVGLAATESDDSLEARAEVGE